MSALRSKILSVKDIKVERISIPDWGVEVNVRGITGAERSAIKAASQVTDRDDDDSVTGQRLDEATMYALLVIESVSDPETGEPVFAAADRDALKEKSAGVLEDVSQIILRLSGLTLDSVKAIRKNSDATPSADSPSA
jgi:hypothetical protein